MNRIILISILFFPIVVFAQKYSISGYVFDNKTGERLIGATVFNIETGQGTAANNYGFFSLSADSGQYNLQFRYIGFQTKNIQLTLQRDTFLQVGLLSGIDLKGVKVTAPEFNRKNPELSGLNQPKIDMQMIESTPVILGERDVLKTIQYLPGVKQGTENTAGFNVRGGSSDQNLILLDGVPVYNVNHLLGFFSIFNSDAIKDVTLIKGGMPARYGGRLSSVLDISMKEGNMKNSSGVFSISPVALRFTYEAPIKKDTSAFIISFRRTFFDIPMRAIEKLIGENGTFGYYFYDVNAKANWIFSPKSRLYLSVYSGIDKQFSNTNEGKDSNSKYRYQWGNITSVIRWNKIFSSRLFSNSSLYFSKFNHSELGKTKDNSIQTIFKTTSELSDFSFQTDFDYYTNNSYTFRFGAKISHFIFSPNIVQARSTETDIEFNNQNKTQTNQTDIYIENAFNLGNLRFNVGGRLSGYFTDEKNYLNFQPRFSANLGLSPKFSISTSYVHMSQNIHLLTNSSLGMPTDLWVGSTNKIGPQLSRQVSFGVSKKIKEEFLFEIEGYYKWMDNIIRFDEGTSFTNPKASDWEDNVVVGQGKSYGIEAVIRKEKGNITGLLSYTLSWSDRKFDELNHGKWFPFKYDRRHDISLLAEYKLKETYKTRRSFSVGFTLQSGNNLSVPDTETEGLLLPGRDFIDDPDTWETVRHTYDNPNNFKMPAFHHLDLGYNIVREKTDSKTITWSFSVYNAYNRMNPWYYYKNGDKVKQVSLFPIVPSIGFKYTF